VSAFGYHKKTYVAQNLQINLYNTNKCSTYYMENNMAEKMAVLLRIACLAFIEVFSQYRTIHIFMF
jgi:hypothetical protein